MSATAIVHDPFVTMLRYFIEKGQTRNERELAQMALDIYQLVPTHPLVVNYVNEYALRVMS